MDAGTVKIIADTKRSLRKIIANSQMVKMKKYDLIIRRIMLLNNVLENFTTESMICCQGPRPREECNIINLVHTMTETLAALFDYIPVVYIEMMGSPEHFNFTMALERMQNDSQSCKREFKNCSNITDGDMNSWRESCGSVQMLMYSRYGFIQNKDWVTTKLMGKVNLLGVQHDKKWELIGERGYLLPEVRHINGIQHLLDHRVFFASKLLHGRKCGKCSKCDVHLNSEEECCAILDTCDHLMCSKCAYKMAAKNDMRCNICEVKAARWSTTDIIMVSSGRYLEAQKEMFFFIKSVATKGLGLLSLYAASHLCYLYYY